MDERRKKKIKDRLFAVSMLMLAGLFAFIIYMAATKRSTDMLYYGVIVVFLIVFWALTDILPITLTGGFEGKSDAQKQAYRTYAIIDAVGLAGLGYFAMSLNGNGMMGAIVYAAAIMMKRKYYDEYRDGRRSAGGDGRHFRRSPAGGSPGGGTCPGKRRRVAGTPV